MRKEKSPNMEDQKDIRKVGEAERTGSWQALEMHEFAIAIKMDIM